MSSPKPNKLKKILTTPSRIDTGLDKLKKLKSN